VGLVVLTGASGAGKTTIAKAFAAAHGGVAEVRHFDHIPVPSIDEMIERHGSPDEWQRVATMRWLRELAEHLGEQPNILFEGQARVSFIQDAVDAAAIPDVRIILVDCGDMTRAKRLGVDRQQPELASKQMMDWARFLREEAQHQKLPILDTSRLTIAEAVGVVLTYFPRAR
jgi:energy-coupling factor transporter ATP-binding protein EcfA2